MLVCVSKGVSGCVCVSKGVSVLVCLCVIQCRSEILGMLRALWNNEQWWSEWVSKWAPLKLCITSLYKCVYYYHYYYHYYYYEGEALMCSTSGYWLWHCRCVQHDAQMDYYGTKLATCSSDRSVKIFDVRGDQQSLVADLKGFVCALLMWLNFDAQVCKIFMCTLIFGSTL